MKKIDHPLSHVKEVMISNWLNEQHIKNYTINDDFTVDVDGDVLLQGRELKNIPIQFGTVKGNFLCWSNKLASLEGSPHTVFGFFNCSANMLTSLEFAPKIIYSGMNCSQNKITSLKFAPKIINGNFDVRSNSLNSLEFCPEEILGNFECGNNNLTKIDDFPRIVKGEASFVLNPIQDLLNSVEITCDVKLTGSNFEKLGLIEHIKEPMREYQSILISRETIIKLKNAHNLSTELHQQLNHKNSTHQSKIKI